MSKLEGVKSAEVDTTATAVLIMAAPDQEPTKEKLNEALKPRRCEVRKLEKVERPKPAAVYEITIDGVG